MHRFQSGADRQRRDSGQRLVSSVIVDERRPNGNVTGAMGRDARRSCLYHGLLLPSETATVSKQQQIMAGDVRRARMRRPAGAEVNTGRQMFNEWMDANGIDEGSEGQPADKAPPETKWRKNGMAQAATTGHLLCGLATGGTALLRCLRPRGRQQMPRPMDQSAGGEMIKAVVMGVPLPGFRCSRARCWRAPPRGSLLRGRQNARGMPRRPDVGERIC